MPLQVKQGESSEKDEERAVSNVFAQINQPGIQVVIFFCSTNYDLNRIGRILEKKISCPLVGCTTSGEITSQGYRNGSIVAVSLASKELRAHPYIISPLSSFQKQDAKNLADTMSRRLSLSTGFDPNRMFGLLLIDGLSMLEEQIVAMIHGHFSGISMLGGSAGDDLKFKTTSIYSDGRFISDAAAFVLFETTHCFHIFRTQHFEPSGTKIVITKADPPQRIVFEINGVPAAREYAALLGLKIEHLTPMVFAKHPLMLKIGGEYYVRSIQKVNNDQSLSFFCAIDNGLVLTMAAGIDLLKNLENQLDQVRRKIPAIRLIIGFDCILRKLEVIEKGLQNDVKHLLNPFNFVGFNTYGEQINAIHVNQTLTAVAIGD